MTMAFLPFASKVIKQINLLFLLIMGSDMSEYKSMLTRILYPIFVGGAFIGATMLYLFTFTVLSLGV